MSAKDDREAWSRTALSNRCGDHRSSQFAIKLISIFRRKASGNSGLTVFWYEGPALISCCIVRLVTRLLLANKTMNRELLQSQHHQVQRISTSSKFTVTICWASEAASQSPNCRSWSRSQLHSPDSKSHLMSSV
jgi:hypothetical protein